jgi:hypothetical protein
LKKIKDGIADEFEGIFPIGRQLIFLISNVNFKKLEFPSLYDKVSDLDWINCASTGCEISGSWLTAKLAYLTINEKREKFKTDKGNSYHRYFYCISVFTSFNSMYVSSFQYRFSESVLNKHCFNIKLNIHEFHHLVSKWCMVATQFV